MSRHGQGQVRRTQVVTTYGPGALIDLPEDAAIVGGLSQWPPTTELAEVREPRLARKIGLLTGLADPRLFAPPVGDGRRGARPTGIGAWRFPEWFVVQEREGRAERERSRRLVHRRALDERGRYDGHPVVATRFVRACPRGHVDDVNWRDFAHGRAGDCVRQLWLDERGTTGDLADLALRCECGVRRRMSDATMLEQRPLGTCTGARPWLGRHTEEACDHPARLLIRTASNAYFPQLVTVLSIPDRDTALSRLVEELWDDLGIVQTVEELRLMRRKPRIAQRLGGHPDDAVLAAIAGRRGGAADDRPVKLVELDAILGAPEGYGDDQPINPDFHARRLPEAVWREGAPPRARALLRHVEAVVALHRLREVMALVGFTRLEPVTPDVHGDPDSEVERAAIDLEPAWFPAVENRGEGLFVQLRADAVRAWRSKTGVVARVDALQAGHERWRAESHRKQAHPGDAYVLLHTLSHLLLQSISMRCGYPASSIRERIYLDVQRERYGLLLYTGSPDAEGTLGGLVGRARHLGEHLDDALRAASLCSNDPVCSQHAPAAGLEQRWLHGASCHGCALISETSCEMRNDHLDRALVVPVLGCTDAAFFESADP